MNGSRIHIEVYACCRKCAKRIFRYIHGALTFCPYYGDRLIVFSRGSNGCLITAPSPGDT